MKSISYFDEQFMEALGYYRASNPKSARDFVTAFERAKETIVRFPKIGTPKGEYRYLPLKNFPYRVCYVENMDGEIILVTLFHYKQRELHIDVQ